MGYSRIDAIRIATDFVSRAARRHRIHRAFLFGSTVWGQPTAYSDIDLALVLEPSVDCGESGGREEFELFHAAQEHNSALEIICFTPEEFEEVDGSTLIRRIKKTGLELSVVDTESLSDRV